jgi:voltage-gated potassium channel Kch
MVKLRAIHLIAVMLIVVIFIVSTVLTMLAGYPPFTSMLFSFLNIIGATFPPADTLIDAQSVFILTSVALGGIANVAFIITFTAIFYQMLSGVDLRSAFVREKLRGISKHVVITPINAMGLDLAKKLRESKVQVVFIDENKFAVGKALRQGLLAIRGDPADSDSLDRAKAVDARAVYTLYDDDIKNTFVAIETKKLGRKVKVISRIRRMEDIPKIERSGVSRIVLPEAAVGVSMGEFLMSRS